ncbi:MAG: hypothetical protein ACREP6_16125 [Candidatus Binataceae bacterium]
MDEAGRTAMLAMAEKLRLRTGQLAAALELLDEIALREKISAAAILANPAIEKVMDSPGSAPARASHFLAALRALRFPHLTRVRDRLLAEVRALGLPSSTRIRLPAELASDELVVEIRARTGRELEQSIEALYRRMPQLKRIAERLGGGDEI